MNKKTAIAIFILVLIFSGGGFLLWQNSKAAVKDLNATLPEGVRVVKSLFGNEYRVVNKIDGYEFKVPQEWRGIEEIAYTPRESLEKYTLSTIEVIGYEGQERFVSVNSFQKENDGLNLMQWAQKNFETFGLEGNFQQERVGKIDVVKTQEGTSLAGMYVYFFENTSMTYAITNASEDYVRKIIMSGKW